MAQHDFQIDNSTGQNVRIDINNVLKAILTNNAGSTDPATVIAAGVGSKAYSFWADTNSSPAVLKIRNSADNGWIELFQLDGTLTLEDGSESTPGLAFRDDLNTGIFSSGADNFDIATGGTVRVNVSSSGLTVSDDLIITDKIVHKDDTNTAIRFPSNDNIKFEVNGFERLRIDDLDFVTVKHATTAKLRIQNSTAATSQVCMLDMAPAGTASGVQLKCVSDDDFSTGGNRTAHFKVDIRNSGTFFERLRIDNLGRLLLGTTTEGEASADNLTIADSGNCGITIRSGTSNAGAIYFSDGTSGGAEYRGLISYHQGSDYFQIFTAELERIRVDSTGQVGIGTTAPATQLEVKDSGDSRITITAGNTFSQTGINFADSSGIDGICTYDHNTRKLHLGAGTSTFTDGDITIDSSGQVGIGITSPAAKLQVNDTNPVIAEFFRSDGGNNDEARIALGALSTNIPSQRGVQLAAVNNGAGHDFSIRTSPSASLGPTEKVRVTSGGTTMFGRTTTLGASELVTVHSDNGQGLAIGFGTGTNERRRLYMHSTGLYFDSTTNQAYLSAGGAWVDASDISIKKDIEDITYGITTIKNLKPRKYKMKADDEAQIGFIAQEMQEQVPEVVGGKEGSLGIAYGSLTAVLTKALQEAVAKIEVLETKVAALEAA